MNCPLMGHGQGHATQWKVKGQARGNAEIVFLWYLRFSADISKLFYYRVRVI